MQSDGKCLAHLTLENYSTQTNIHLYNWFLHMPRYFVFCIVMTESFCKYKNLLKKNNLDLPLYILHLKSNEFRTKLAHEGGKYPLKHHLVYAISLVHMSGLCIFLLGLAHFQHHCSYKCIMASYPNHVPGCSDLSLALTAQLLLHLKQLWRAFFATKNTPAKAGV